VSLAFMHGDQVALSPEGAKLCLLEDLDEAPQSLEKGISSTTKLGREIREPEAQGGQ